MNKKFHFIWVINKMHTLHYIAVKHNLKLLEDYDVTIWTDEIKNVHPEFRHLARLIDKSILSKCMDHPGSHTPGGNVLRVPHYVDLLRYNILLEEGGTYLDCDEFLLKDPTEFVDPTKVNFRMESRHCVTNSFIHVPDRGNSHIAGLIDLLDSPDFDTGEWASTGPAAVTKYLNEKFPEAIDHCRVYANGQPSHAEAHSKGIYEGIHLLMLDSFPMGWSKFHDYVTTGKIFDTDQFSKEGYSILVIFGSTSTKKEWLEVEFKCNHGTYKFPMDQRGRLDYD